ncbi:MAG: PHP domain-containing protein [Candidatus Methylomirabilota bacterium]|nr:PHP domain-containing protein [Candidatus Methylomirabilis sp.]NJD68694.1 PHP domain-containing protein [candidate division NC10 bacterium]PWB44263.1 MAG: PHP domain-containing protein [candidate division NC10 bacterium]
MASRVDLHLHTTASDGALRPNELVRAADSIGIRVIAVTDHDSVNGIAEAQEAALDLALEVIPGIEISASLDRDDIHVLGYLLDPNEPSLQTALRRLREDRLAQARAMVERLGALGHPLEWDRVMAIADGGSVGRPHIAKALVERGAVATVDEAFSQFLRRGGPGYVEGPTILPQEAVELIRGAHGLPSLAHPIIVGASDYHPDLERLLPILKEAGLEGIETYYKGYTPEITASLLAIVDQYRLIPTGGSDFHGGGVVADAELGGVEVPWESVERLRSRRQELDARRVTAN